MLNIIIKEVTIDEELKTRIKFMCDFCNIKPTIINGSVRRIEKTNINYIEPNKIIIKDTTFLAFNHVKDILFSFYQILDCQNLTQIISLCVPYTIFPNTHYCKIFFLTKSNLVLSSSNATLSTTFMPFISLSKGYLFKFSISCL